MAGRVMPDRGYYAGVGYPNVGWSEVVFSTGDKKGNKYWRSYHENGWVTLVWTCVPGRQELARDYVYYPTYEAFIEGFHKGEHKVNPGVKSPTDL